MVHSRERTQTIEARITTTQGLSSFGLMGTQVTPIADGGATAGAWELGHLSVEPGGGTPLHAIAADKVFYVLAGEVELEVGDEQRSGQAGAVATIPAGVPHSYRNAGEASAELLVITTGGGHIDFLAGMAELVARQAPDPRSIADFAGAHGVSLL